MKKLITFFTLVASMAVNSAFAEESYIYWMVDVKDSKLSWDYVTLYAEKTISGTKTTAELERMTDNATEHVVTSKLFDNSTAYTDGWSYYVELFNEDEESVGKSSYLAYSGLLKSGAIRNQSSATAVSHATFTIEAVPEPTTGVMLLMGLALVGLKRKRA